jgi:hypothetical protein
MILLYSEEALADLSWQKPGHLALVALVSVTVALRLTLIPSGNLSRLSTAVPTCASRHLAIAWTRHAMTRQSLTGHTLSRHSLTAVRRVLLSGLPGRTSTRTWTCNKLERRWRRDAAYYLEESWDRAGRRIEGSKEMAEFHNRLA